MTTRQLTFAALLLNALAGLLVLYSGPAPTPLTGVFLVLMCASSLTTVFLCRKSALARQPESSTPVSSAPPAPVIPAAAQPPPAPAAPIPPPPVSPPSAPTLDPAAVADAAALRLLARFQEQARLIDFALEDIRSVPDAQVAAAARVVHAGCQKLLQSGFTLRPLRAEAEGATITLPEGFDPAAVRLLGRVAGSPPYTGLLLHRGWFCDALNLPRPLDYAAPASPVVAPAELELR